MPNLALNLYDGVYQSGNMSVNPSSFDAQGRAVTRFDAEVTGCELSAEGDAFTVVPAGGNSPVPLLDRLVMSNVSVLGTLDVNASGVEITEGTINGYVHQDTLIDLVRELQMECSSNRPPSICAQVGLLLNGSPEFVANSLLAPFMRNYDTEIDENGVPRGGCALGTCNAISVCLVFSASPITLLIPSNKCAVVASG